MRLPRARSRRAGPADSTGGLGSDRLELSFDLQRHRIADARWFHPMVGALDHHLTIEAHPIARRPESLPGLVEFRIQHYRFGDTEEGQLTVHAQAVSGGARDVRRLERGGRKFHGVEELITPEPGVEIRNQRADA